MADPLTEEEIREGLKELPDWKFENDRLQAAYVFKNFSEALAFIVRVGVASEKMNHHPELRNVWNRVELALTTHDAGNKVTSRDMKLARRIRKIAPEG